jgi:hypothetical protein
MTNLVYLREEQRLTRLETEERWLLSQITMMEKGLSENRALQNLIRTKLMRPKVELTSEMIEVTDGTH